jgi:hypothetical protein
MPPLLLLLLLLLVDPMLVSVQQQQQCVRWLPTTLNGWSHFHLVSGCLVTPFR